MSNVINLIATRALSLAGERIEPGAALRVAPLEAHALLGAGRARLRDEGDAAAVLDAVNEANYRQARTAPGYIPAVRDPRWS